MGYVVNRQTIVLVGVERETMVGIRDDDGEDSQLRMIIESGVYSGGEIFVCVDC